MSLPAAELPLTRQRTETTILGLATASPDHSIAQQDAALIAQKLVLSPRWNDALPALYRKSGVERRGSVLLGPESLDPLNRQSLYKPADAENPYGPTTCERMLAFAEFAGPMLAQACKAALSQAGLDAWRITHLITLSCTGFCAPGVDIDLIESLELNTQVQRTHIGFMGCHAALNGMRVAKAIVDADPQAVVLLGAVELCSLHQQYSDDPQQLVANALFADGAAALVIGAREDRDPLALKNLSENSRSAWNVVSTFSKWLPATHDRMSWTIGDHGFRMGLDPLVPSIIEANLEKEMTGWLEEQSLTVQDIEAWAIHPGGPRILQAAGHALGLQPSLLQPSESILADHGNMSSPTVLFILKQIAKSKPNATSCVLLAFGPGLCTEAVLLRS